MNGYSRPRVTIGVFPTVRSLCDCASAVIGAVPDLETLFVLTASAEAAARFGRKVREDFSDVDAQKFKIIGEDGPSISDGHADPGSPLNGAHVAGFGEWLDAGSARMLRDQLAEGHALLFVPALDPSQQFAVFREMRTEVCGKVIMHDLPARQAGAPAAG